MPRRAILALALVCMASPSCTENTSEERGLTEVEALSDLDVLAEHLRNDYALLDFKKARFGFDLDVELANARSKIHAGTSEADRVRPLVELVSKLKDGHTTLRYPARRTSTLVSGLPSLSLRPVGEDYYVDAPAPAPSPFIVGDRLVSIDGRTARELEQLLLPLCEIGTRESSRRRVADHMTSRPFYAGPALQPHGEKAIVVVERDGSLLTSEVGWVRHKTGEARESTAAERDESRPWYLAPETAAQLGIKKAVPGVGALLKHGVFADSAPSLSAFRYRFEGKKILLLRIPTFRPMAAAVDEHVGWAAALLDDANVDGTDRVVVDVTGNPGGSFHYVEGLVSLFLERAIPNELIARRADREHIEVYRDLVSEATSRGDLVARQRWTERMGAVEAASQRGDRLAPFAPSWGAYLGPKVGPKLPRSGLVATGQMTISPHPLGSWKGPVLVLHDEGSGSCGDGFPAILQRGGVAKTFGARTAGMGGLKGVFLLPVSGAPLTLTVGRFGVADGNGGIVNIENDGVTPDYPRALTRADLQNGYVDYVRDFSKVAIGLTR